MRIISKLVKPIHVFLYRLTKFVGAMSRLKALLLTMTGRKMGRQRTTPLGYFRSTSSDGYLIIGSIGGLDWNPAWQFQNPKTFREVKTVEEAVWEKSF
jgi:hypothetical protein